MGTSIATTLWESRAALHHAHLAEGLQQGSGAMADALTSLRAAGLGEGAARAQITRLIDQQAYTRAANVIFLASAVIFLALIGLVWLTRRPLTLVVRIERCRCRCSCRASARGWARRLSSPQLDAALPLRCAAATDRLAASGIRTPEIAERDSWPFQRAR